MTMNSTLQIRRLTKSYRGFTLDGVCFDVPEGYVTGLIGPNGAGKTTIIKSIMNLLRPDSGDIRVFGLDHRADEVSIKRRIGFVYDEPCFPGDSTLQDIRRAIAPFYEHWDEPCFQRLIREFELPLHKRFRKLSHGMQMKFALAMALSHHADLLLMDEPTAGLDPVFRRELLGRLGCLLQDERKTVLFSTHITSDLERIADFIVCLHKGKLLFALPKDELLDSWAVVKGGAELLAGNNARLFRGWRKSAVGVEALTDNLAAVRRQLGAQFVAERPSIEDVMVLITKGDQHD